MEIGTVFPFVLTLLFVVQYFDFLSPFYLLVQLAVTHSGGTSCILFTHAFLLILP